MTKRNISYDIIRAIAIFFVICIHSLGLVNNALTIENTIGLAHITNALMGIVYSGVPLFVMLSGALLLGKEESLKSFFCRRLTRVLIPFLLWSLVVYAILYWQDEGDSIIGFVSSYIVQSLTDGVYGIYWYIYMLLGLYAITPPIRIILRHSSKSIHSYLLVLTFVVAFVSESIPEVSIIRRLSFENCIWLFYFFMGFFIVKNMDIVVRYRHLVRWIFGILMIINIIIRLFDLTYALLNLLLYITLFMTLLTLKPSSSRICKGIQLVSRESYGIYLSHFMLISSFLRLNVFQQIPMLIEPLCMAVAVLFVNVAILYVLAKLRLGKYVM